MSAANVNVSFYDGDPDGVPEGRLLGSKRLYLLTDDSKSASVQWTATEGQHIIWVVVDPENNIPEYDKFNNMVSEVLFVERISYDHAPELSDLSVSPSSGKESTLFTFQVTYSDADNDPPTSISVVIDGQVRGMTEENMEDNNFVDGKIFIYQTNLKHGLRDYYFECINANISDKVTLGNASVPYTISVTEGTDDNGEAGADPITRSEVMLIIVMIVIIVILIALLLSKREGGEEGKKKDEKNNEKI
jgi:hypothetical protein